MIEFFIRLTQVEQKKNITEMDVQTREALLAYDYPGNIRELKNIIERLVALSEDGVIRGVSYLQAVEEDSGYTRRAGYPADRPLRSARAEFEKQYIEEVLREQRGDVTRSAEILAITKRQLWNKIADYQIDYKHL